MALSRNSDTDGLLSPTITEENDGSPEAETQMTDPKARCCRGCFFYVEPVLVLFCFVAFPIQIVLQVYVLEWVAVNLVNQSVPAAASGSQCSANNSEANNEIQSLASLFSVIHSCVWGIPAIAVTIFLGAGSDIFGRRFALLPPLFGVVCSSSVAYAVVSTQSSILWLLLGAILYGFGGSFASMLMACFAYVADRTPAEKRMMRITVVEMSMLVPSVVSPIILGSIVHAVGVANVLLITVIISVINFLYVFFFFCDDSSATQLRTQLEYQVKTETICDTPYDSDCHSPMSDNDVRNTSGSLAANSPADYLEPGISRLRFEDMNNIEVSQHESLISSNPHTTSIRHVDLSHSLNYDSTDNNPHVAELQIQGSCAKLWAGIRQTTGLFLQAGPRRWKLCLLLCTFCISVLPVFDFTLASLYEMNRPLCWSPNMVGIFTGASLGVSTVGALIATPLMKKCLSDLAISLTAVISLIITEVYKAFVRNSLMMYLSVTLSMFAILLTPSLRSIMSCLVSDHEQGSIFGAIASVEVFCLVTGTVIFNSIYAATLDISSGFVFLVMAAFHVISCCCLIFYWVRVHRRDRQLEMVDAENSENFSSIESNR